MSISPGSVRWSNIGYIVSSLRCLRPELFRVLRDEIIVVSVVDTVLPLDSFTLVSVPAAEDSISPSNAESCTTDPLQKIVPLQIISIHSQPKRPCRASEAVAIDTAALKFTMRPIKNS